MTTLDVIASLFTQIMVITGLSPLALIFFLLATWKSARTAWSENDTIVGVAAQICFYVLIWWLVGYLILNPIWNWIIAGIL